MSYSFTEKKRIRKSFANRPSVLAVPPLLDIQLRSYADFLQADVKPNARKDIGLAGRLYLHLPGFQPQWAGPP